MGLYKRWILNNLYLFTDEELIEWGFAETKEEVKELREMFP